MSEETRRRTASEGLRDSPSAAKDTLSQETLRLYEFGPFRLDPAERKLLRGNEIVALTPKAFDTLLLLVRNSGHLLEKDDLISMLWPNTFVEEGSLSNNIFLLRKALGEDPAFIETIPRRGYRFIGAVRQFPGAATTHPEISPEVGAGVKGMRALSRRPLILNVGALLLVAIVTGLAIWKLQPLPLDPPEQVTRSVIILPPGQQLAGMELGPAVALSPDGTHLAYIVRQGPVEVVLQPSDVPTYVARQGGTQQIYLRAMDSLEAKPIPGTGGPSTHSSPPTANS